MALPHPIPYSASGCHHMSQRANACHCPEVTRELNRFSHTTSPRTKARTLQAAQAVMCTLSVWREAAEEPLPTAGCGAVWLLRVMDDRSAQRDPTSPARSTGVQEAQQGTTAVPRRTERAQLHHPGTTELWLCLAFRFGLLWLQTGLGFERSLSPALCAETSSKSTEAMHAAASEKQGTVCWIAIAVVVSAGPLVLTGLCLSPADASGLSHVSRWCSCLILVFFFDFHRVPLYASSVLDMSLLTVVWVSPCCNSIEIHQVEIALISTQLFPSLG